MPPMQPSNTPLRSAGYSGKLRPGASIRRLRHAVERYDRAKDFFNRYAKEPNAMVRWPMCKLAELRMFMAGTKAAQFIELIVEVGSDQAPTPVATDGPTEPDAIVIAKRILASQPPQ
jgi:hypothetical protein